MQILEGPRVLKSMAAHATDLAVDTAVGSDQVDLGAGRAEQSLGVIRRQQVAGVVDAELPSVQCV